MNDGNLERIGSLVLKLRATVAAVMSAAAVATCTSVSESPLPILPLTPVASVHAPLSFVNDVALVTDTIACVADSYEFQIHCLAHSGRTVGTFGGKGEGPGEFQGVAKLERAAGGAIAVLDIRLDRVTVFSPHGTLLWESSAPGIRMNRLNGEHVYGYLLDFSTGIRLSIPAELDLRSGAVVWTGDAIVEGADAECLFTSLGAMSREEIWVSWNCNHELVVFENRDGPGVARLSPAYVAELPNQRDVDEYLEGLARIGAGYVRTPPRLSESYAAEYRSKPKRWYLGRGQTFKFDDQGRIWAATTYNRDERSYIEVWDGSEYLTTVEVRDRLLGYDLLGDLLAVHVERKPDRLGVAPRAIDWYRVPEF